MPNMQALNLYGPNTSTANETSPINDAQDFHLVDHSLFLIADTGLGYAIAPSGRPCLSPVSWFKLASLVYYRVQNLTVKISRPPSAVLHQGEVSPAVQHWGDVCGASTITPRLCL